MNNDIIPINIISVGSTEIPINTNIGNLDYEMSIATDGNEIVNVTVKDNVIHSDLPVYQGDYEVTPRVENQTLSTNHTQMADNIVVRQIPLSVVGNIQGGLTATIG